MTFGRHLITSLYWFATNFHWGALLLILLPGDIRVLAPETPAQTLGLLTGLGAIPALIVPLIAGALSDRCTRPEGRRKPYIATGVMINLIGLGLMAVSVALFKSFLAYILGYVLVQIGNNIASGAYMGVIPDVVPIEERGKASGFMALMSQLGTLFGAIGVGMLLGDAGAIAKYGLVGAMLLIIGALTYFKLHEEQQKTSEPINWSSYIKSLWIDPREYPNFAWVWFTRFMVMLGFYAIVPFINYYLVDVVKIPVDQVDSKAPILMGVILLVSSISGIYGGGLSDRIGRKKVVYISNGLIAVIAPMFILAHSMPLALLIGALFGLGYGAYISVDYALGTDVLPSEADAGKDMAVWHIAMTLPQSIAAPIAGFLIAFPGKTVTPPIVAGGEPTTHYTLLGYGIIFSLCSLCFAIGAYLLKNVRGVR